MTQTEENGNWKIKMLAIGGALGALVGVGTAYLMARNVEEKQSGPPKIKTSDALRISVSAIGLIRGIIALTDN